MTVAREATAVLEQEYLPLRARILEIAAGLDRLDRAEGGPPDDERRQRLRQGIALLLGDGPDRAEQVQLLFSREYDRTWRERFKV